MTKLLFVVSVLFAGAACGSKAGDALGEMEGLKNEMCKCTDMKCVEGVEKKADEWKKKMKDSGMKKDDLSDDQKKKAKDIGSEMSKCRMDIMMKDKGGSMGGGDKPAGDEAPKTP